MRSSSQREASQGQRSRVRLFVVVSQNLVKIGESVCRSDRKVESRYCASFVIDDSKCFQCRKDGNNSVPNTWYCFCLLSVKAKEKRRWWVIEMDCGTIHCEESFFWMENEIHD